MERALGAEGYPFVAGVDEVGRGPLAGPVVAAAVILPLDADFTGVNDSKKLSSKKREALAAYIKEHALSYSIFEVDEKTIDRINIREATPPCDEGRRRRALFAALARSFGRRSHARYRSSAEKHRQGGRLRLLHRRGEHPRKGCTATRSWRSMQNFTPSTPSNATRATARRRTSTPSGRWVYARSIAGPS